MNNVVLVGFMGSGKTTVGRELAARLHRSFVDLDQEIEAEAGRSIAEVFQTEGESGFRRRERRSLERALHGDGTVIAAGGGAAAADDNWRRMRAGNTVVALMAEPAELGRRLQHSDGRPLLAADPAGAVATLLPPRMARYLEADLVIPTDGEPPASVAAEVVQRLPRSAPHRIPIGIPGSPHEATVGFGLTGLVTTAIRRLAAAANVLVVTDRRVLEPHGERIRAALPGAGLRAHIHVLPAGEAAKELAVLAGIYEALSAAEVDREGLLIALGGGAVGDVCGFAAATWMRGIRYLQVPTTLLAVVDSSIGGKTAINLPAGKNMAGAVHQPSAIFADLDYLATLPDEDYRSSIAEIIKVAMVADPTFVEWLGHSLAALLRRDDGALQHAVSRAIEIKAQVVARDPQETGERAILNYGHTVGHALERSLGYGRIRHGNAVAWGMEVAGRISNLMGRCSPDDAAAQHELLARAGLLTDRPEVNRTMLLDSLRHDKKARLGTARWVLLRELGGADYGIDVPSAIVRDALDQVLPE